MRPPPHIAPTMPRQVLAVLGLLALAGTTAACGQGRPQDAPMREDICPRIADRLEARLRFDETNAPVIRALGATDRETRLRHLRGPAENDALYTYLTAREMGRNCAGVGRPDCTDVGTLFLDDLDAALRRTRLLLDGMRGIGPCAPSEAQRRIGASCSDVDAALPWYDPIDRVREGWAKPFDVNGQTPYASHAALQMARWRAAVDYAVDVVEFCAPSAAPSCAKLRDGLFDATPDELFARVLSLHHAFAERTWCPSTSVVDAKDDAGP